MDNIQNLPNAGLEDVFDIRKNGRKHFLHFGKKPVGICRKQKEPLSI